MKQQNSETSLKEALEIIRDYHNQISLLCKGKLNNRIINAENQIEKDLDQLEKLEKENKELKERYKHRAETSNDLCKAVKQYEKAFDILVNKVVNTLILKYCIAKGGGVETYNLHYKTEEKLTQEEYELLKEVFGND